MREVSHESHWRIVMQCFVTTTGLIQTVIQTYHLVVHCEFPSHLLFSHLMIADSPFTLVPLLSHPFTVNGSLSFWHNSVLAVLFLLHLQCQLLVPFTSSSSYIPVLLLLLSACVDMLSIACPCPGCCIFSWHAISLVSSNDRSDRSPWTHSLLYIHIRSYFTTRSFYLYIRSVFPYSDYQLLSY